MTPRPPAFVTAAASLGPAATFMPARRTGCLILRRSVTGVRICCGDDMMKENLGFETRKVVKRMKAGTVGMEDVDNLKSVRRKRIKESASPDATRESNRTGPAQNAVARPGNCLGSEKCHELDLFRKGVIQSSCFRILVLVRYGNPWATLNGYFTQRKAEGEG